MELLGGSLLTGLICLVGLLMLAGLIGVVVFLVKLGVIGSYWLQGDQPGQEAEDYRLDQSHEM